MRLSVPGGRFLQSQKAPISTEILRVIGWVGSWLTFFEFPLALLCSLWLCWRWYRVHFGITSQLRGLWQSLGVNKENYESFEIQIDRSGWWRITLQITISIQSRTKAAVVNALIYKPWTLCVRVRLNLCAFGFVWFMCGCAFWHTPAGLHQTVGEMKAFHNDTQYMTRPTVIQHQYSSTCSTLVVRCVLFLFLTSGPHCDQYKMTNPVQVMLLHPVLEFLQD